MENKEKQNDFWYKLAKIYVAVSWPLAGAIFAGTIFYDLIKNKDNYFEKKSSIEQKIQNDSRIKDSIEYQNKTYYFDPK